MDACSLLCAPTLGRSVRHGQIIRSRAVRLSSRCSSSNTAGDSNGHSHAIGCFMLLLMLALNRTLTGWHDNSPFNSPPPLAVTLSLPSLLSFVLSSYHLSYSLRLSSVILIPPPSSSLALSRYPVLAETHRMALLPLLLPSSALILAASLEKKKISPSRGPAAGHNPRPVGRRHWAIQRCMQHAACTRHAPRAA